jgi:hypothetical protein
MFPSCTYGSGMISVLELPEVDFARVICKRHPLQPC